MSISGRTRNAYLNIGSVNRQDPPKKNEGTFPRASESGELGEFVSEHYEMYVRTSWDVSMSVRH